MEPKQIYRSYQFRNSIAWSSDRRGMLSAAQHPSVAVGNPPEFKGSADVWCPEDLLIGALNTCFMLTFLSLAQKEKVDVAGYKSTAEGTVEHRDGKFRVTRIQVLPRVALKSAADTEAARVVMKRTKDVCMITNSILATVNLSAEFEECGDELSAD